MCLLVVAFEDNNDILKNLVKSQQKPLLLVMMYEAGYVHLVVVIKQTDT